MKKIIIILIVLLLITACSGEKNIKTSSSLKNVQGYEDLRKQADPIAIESNNLKLNPRQQTEIAIAIKNNHESKSTFSINPTCNNAQGNEVNLIQNKKGSISKGKTAVIKLGINTKHEKMPYICSIQVSSNKGMKASKELLVEIA